MQHTFRLFWGLLGDSPWWLWGKGGLQSQTGEQSTCPALWWGMAWTGREWGSRGCQRCSCVAQSEVSLLAELTGRHNKTLCWKIFLANCCFVSANYTSLNCRVQHPCLPSQQHSGIPSCDWACCTHSLVGRLLARQALRSINHFNHSSLYKII